MALVFVVLAVVPAPTFAQLDFSQVIRRSAPSVVTVLAKGRGSRVGSGFVLSREGLIATNFHVIEDASELEIELTTGDRFRATTIVHQDKQRDLAVLKIPAFDLAPITLGNSNSIEVGQPVIAVGAPRGLSTTTTAGIISAIRPDPEDRGFRLIQTDAAVNPGSSGGPLLNMKGEVIGVVVGKMKGAEGLNFAVPINYLRGLLSDRPLNLAIAPATQVAPTRPISAREQPRESPRGPSTSGTVTAVASTCSEVMDAVVAHCTGSRARGYQCQTNIGGLLSARCRKNGSGGSCRAAVLGISDYCNIDSKSYRGNSHCDAAIQAVQTYCSD